MLTVTAGGGAIEGYLLLFWDVTEQQRFEESRRRFISMLSHQLKTPMTSLSMSVNLMREKIRDAAPAQAELLSIATEDCNNLAALISDLIDAAKDVTPELTLKTRRIDIVRLLRSSLRPLVPQAEEKGIDLILPAGGEEILAEVDPVKFPWVVTNIVGNALRYTEPRRSGHRGGCARPRGGSTSACRTRARASPPSTSTRSSSPTGPWTKSRGREPTGSAWPSPRRSWRPTGAASRPRADPGAGTSFHLHLPSQGAPEP